MTTNELFALPVARPGFIEPMYVTSAPELPDGQDWAYEAKLDGYRCLAGKNGGVTLWSRRGTLFTPRFPEIARACDKLPADTVIDGEVVAIGEDGRLSFNALQHHRLKAHLQYYAFDMPIYRGRNVMQLPLETRRELLADALEKVNYPVILSRTFNAKPEDLLRAARELELEGLIAKRKGSTYESGRQSRAWLKYKLQQCQEFVIGGYTTGNPFDALIVGCYEGKNLNYVAKVRAGFVPRVRREVYRRLAEFATDKCAFANLPEKRRTVWALTSKNMENCRWLKPELVAQINFAEWTPDGHLRQASFAGVRDDKHPRDVTRL
jgi:bifunctional non-homologous end joining protein LigD